MRQEQSVKGKLIWSIGLSGVLIVYGWYRANIIFLLGNKMETKWKQGTKEGQGI
jgi:hypothetical protein